MWFTRVKWIIVENVGRQDRRELKKMVAIIILLDGKAFLEHSREVESC
jgi:hypothetical protein